MSCDKPVLGYWDIRGLAAHIKCLLHYLGVDFEDKIYRVGPGPDFDRSEWFKVKYTLGIPLPNLPYYIDGDVKLSQSNAIMRYLARKYGLDAPDEASRIRADIMEGSIEDLRGHFYAVTYYNYEAGKDGFLNKTQPQMFKDYSDFLADYDWFTGNKLTYIDFTVYEVLFQQRVLKRECLDPHPNLQSFMKRFEDLPKVKAYLSSPAYRKLPLNNPNAQWGNPIEY